MAKPFVKCLGGKAKLADQILSAFPAREQYAVYVEPFLGGAAVYFELYNRGVLDGKHVLLGDANETMIELYEAVRDRPHQLYQATRELHDELHTGASDPKGYYRSIRSAWNDGNRKPHYTFFLHRASFNGLWRINKKGEMNADIGLEADKKTPTCSIPPLGQLLECAQALEHTVLLDWDFRQYDEEGLIGPNTVVYLDPPYDGGFVGYTAEGFDDDDQIDVIKLAAKWHAAGAHVVYSNADKRSVRDWIRALWPEARIHETEAFHSVNQDGKGRGPVGELIVSSPLARPAVFAV